MATITERTQADGATRYKAQIRLKKGGVVWHQENKTFAVRAHAETWAVKREKGLREKGPGAVGRLRVANMSAGEAVLAYLRLLESGRKPPNTNMRSCMERVGRWFSDTPAAYLAPADVIEFAAARARGGAAPSTVMQDLIYLRIALREAETVLGIEVNHEAVDKAKSTLKRMGLIASSRRRGRRIEGDEETQLMEEFAVGDSRHSCIVQMTKVMPFAIASCMRQSEITRIRWSDLNDKNHTVLIRERKDPNNKHDRHDVVPLLGDAWGLIQSMPRGGEFIFPYRKDSIRARFARACERRGIVDLHFHDLRREGATRLLEQGYPATKVILVTGHHDWNQFARYVGLRPEELH